MTRTQLWTRTLAGVLSCGAALLTWSAIEGSSTADTVPQDDGTPHDSTQEKRVRISATEPHTPPPERPRPPALIRETDAELPNSSARENFERQADAHQAFLDLWLDDFDDEASPDAQDRALQDAFDEKIAAMTELLAGYDGVFEHEDPYWTARAQLNMGLIYEEMAWTVLELPTPTYLSENQTEVYRQAIEAKANGLLDQAIELFEDVVDSQGEESRSGEDASRGIDHIERERP